MASLLIAIIYLSFISLGLPDSLLGSAWPTMQMSFVVPSSFAGYVSMTICLMTIISSLASPTLIKKIETKWIVIVSITLTVIGLMGFSFSGSYWMLFLFAVPYGLGAGSIDASLNQYVANYYSSRVMNFLHCFYGLGAIISPNIMALALKYAKWNQGYRWTAYLQITILAVCILTLPAWKVSKKKDDELKEKTATIKEALKVPGVILTLIAFFSYCAGEATCFLWTSSYFAGTKEGISDELIAAFGSLIFGGLMLGRLIAGFVSNKLGDRKMIRIGIAVEFTGIILVILPLEEYIVAAIGFLIIGTGMGPIYPAVQHMAPANFGLKYSAPVIGLQMACAYIGATLMPTVFGLIQQNTGIWIMPVYIAVFAALNIVLLEIAYTRLKNHGGQNDT
ncbi:MAG: MFS transporter [Clostridia bacterium]|nr:MFS transporter [Clostridia bacterium]